MVSHFLAPTIKVIRSNASYCSMFHARALPFYHKFHIHAHQVIRNTSFCSSYVCMDCFKWDHMTKHDLAPYSAVRKIELGIITNSRFIVLWVFADIPLTYFCSVCWTSAPAILLEARKKFCANLSPHIAIFLYPHPQVIILKRLMQL